MLNYGITTHDVEKAIIAQTNFTTKNGLDRYSPDDGTCPGCNEQIYDRITVDDAANFLIIACPYCRHSFED